MTRFLAGVLVGAIGAGVMALFGQPTRWVAAEGVAVAVIFWLTRAAADRIAGRS